MIHSKKENRSIDALIHLYDDTSLQQKNVEEIHKFLTGIYGELSASKALSYYITNYRDCKKEPLIFRSTEFEEYGPEIAFLMQKLIGFGFMTYKDIEDVFSRISLFGLSEQISYQALKEAFAHKLFGEIKNDMKNFQVN